MINQSLLFSFFLSSGFFFHHSSPLSFSYTRFQQRSTPLHSSSLLTHYSSVPFVYSSFLASGSVLSISNYLFFICDLLAICHPIRMRKGTKKNESLFDLAFHFTWHLVLVLTSLTRLYFSSNSPSICFFLHWVISPSIPSLLKQHSVPGENTLPSNFTPFLSVHFSWLFL